MQKISFSIIIILIGIIFCGCQVYRSSVMLKSKKNFGAYNVNDSVIHSQYKISPNDLLYLQVQANNGINLIEQTANNQGGNQLPLINQLNYLVDMKGSVNLPIIGEIQLQGYSIAEATELLVRKYTYFLNDPFIILRVMNQRVILFLGSDGQATTITLQNNNTTLYEALAQSGGIPTKSKARKIKLIRKINNKTIVYAIDLSKIENINQGNIILQANDIIYVEPQFNLFREISTEINVFSTLFVALSSFFLFFSAR